MGHLQFSRTSMLLQPVRGSKWRFSSVCQPLQEAFVALCIYCEAETELYDYGNGHSVCARCTNGRIAAGLMKDLADATMRADAASDEFLAVVTEIPSGMPHPDGVQRIKNVSSRLRTARQQMGNAQAR